MTTPFYDITVGGRNVTGEFHQRNLQLTVNDCAGFENDRVDFTLHDDPPLVVPAPKTKFGVTIGYRNVPGSDSRYNGLTQFCGTFELDQVDFSKGSGGSQLKITAHANFMGNDFKQQRDRDFHEKSLKDIVGKIAEETGLEARIDPDIASQVIKHIDQANVSNMQFLTSLGARVGATAKVAEGVLYFGKKGKLKSLSGKALTPVIVFESECTTYSAKLSQRGNYDGVKAKFVDQGTAQEKTVLSGKDGVTKTMPHRYPNEEEAKLASEGHKDDLAKETETLSFTCVGNPMLAAECPVVLIGFRPGIRTAWIADKVTHAISSSGYTTQVECKLPDAEAKEASIEGRD